MSVLTAAFLPGPKNEASPAVILRVGEANSESSGSLEQSRRVLTRPESHLFRRAERGDTVGKQGMLPGPRVDRYRSSPLALPGVVLCLFFFRSNGSELRAFLDILEVPFPLVASL